MEDSAKPNNEVLVLKQLKSIKDALWPLVPALLKKGNVEQHQVGGSDRPAVPWTWTVEEGERSVTVWVASGHPRQILAWHSSDGGRGELLTSVREPYWRLHGNSDEAMRERLQLPW